MNLSETTSEYRIEGDSLNGWILFDRVSDEDMAKVFMRQWRRARSYMDFRLVKVTTTVTREVMPDA